MLLVCPPLANIQVLTPPVIYQMESPDVADRPHKDQFHIQHIAELNPVLPAGSCQ